MKDALIMSMPCSRTETPALMCHKAGIGPALYAVDLHAAPQQDFGLSAEQVDAVMARNVVYHLGLNAGGQQRGRVAAFFAQNLIFQDIFPS